MPTDNDEIIILNGDEDFNTFSDTSKEPKKIYMDFITGDEDDELTPIWAEKADYIDEDRLGEGLENRVEMLDERNRTFNLSLKPATKNELGGIKLGDSLKIDNETGTVDVNPSTVIGPASQLELGGVRIGEGINCDQYGTISVEKYTLPEASKEELGGVRIGNGLRVDNGFLSVSCNSLVNNNNLTDEEQEKVELGELTNIDFVVDVLLRLIDNQNTEIRRLKENLNRYVDKTPEVQGILESGHNVFGGNWDPINKTGGVIVKLEKEYENADYKVLITPCHSTEGQVGNYFIRDKTKNSFRVCNTGSVDIDQFSWLLVPSNIVYNIEAGGTNGEIKEQLPIKFGSGKFNGTQIDDNDAPNVIHFDKQLPNVNYVVFITPVIDLDGNGNEIGQPYMPHQLGDISVIDKTPSKFTVINTGADTKTNFDWIAIPFDVYNQDFNYDSYIFPIHAGSITIINGDEPIIKFNNFKFNNKNFKVFLQLAYDAKGRMGEIYSDSIDQTRTSFKIGHTGTAEYFVIDWITVD